MPDQTTHYPSVILQSNNTLGEFSSEHESSVLTTLKTHFSLPQQLHIEPIIVTPEKSTITVEQVRNLITELGFTTISGWLRVVLIWQAQSLHPVAQQALLKLLEEPPKNTVLCLVTATGGQLLPTIQSRCILLPFSTNLTQSLNSETKEPEQNDLSGTVDFLTHQLSNKTVSYSELFTTLSSFKEKTAAQELVTALSLAIENSTPSPKTTHQLKELNHTHKTLHSNANTVHQLEALVIRCLET